MFLADYHTHTSFSSDSKASMTNMIEKAIQLGLKEIAITDHIDFDYPDPEYPFLFDYKDYYEAIKNCQEKYEKKIHIAIGIEFGLQEIVKEQTQAFYNAHNFDFCIGSTHCINGLELYHNYFYEGKTQKKAYQQYFEDLLNNVKVFDCFQVYGHMDYVNRYGDYNNKNLNYNDFKDIIDEILKLIIKKEKGIEINTSGFRYGLGYAHPKLEILKRYKQLGGEIITIGSDAHTPNDITSHFKEAYELLQAAGFQAITVFRNQKPHWIDL